MSSQLFVTPQGSVNTHQPPTIKACDNCRSQKVRCITDTTESGKCQRCSRMNRACIFRPVQKRKSRKRTDARVAELEREVEAMRSFFGSKLNAPLGDPSSISSGPDINSFHPSLSSKGIGDSSADSQSPISSQSGILPDGHTKISLSVQDTSAQTDVVDRGLVSLEMAASLINIYINALMPHYPVVVLAENFIIDDLRRDKPVLFLSIIAAAAGKCDPQLRSVLSTELLQTFATKLFINGEKSLELVQSLIVTVVWYLPPVNSGMLKFYEYIHMAATMALDLGIGSKPGPLRNIYTTSRTLVDEKVLGMPIASEPDPGEIECRRTFLACFLLSMGVAISVRRPNMLRFNKWLQECVESLETSANSTKYDRSLVTWVKLLHIAEEIESALSLDDPSSTLSYSEPRVQFTVKGLHKRLDKCKDDYGLDISNPTAMIMYHNLVIYLHEIAVHHEHPAAGFKPPWAVEIEGSKKKDLELSAAHIDAVSSCISSSQGLLDIFLSLDTATLRAVPIFVYPRMVYALIMLIKLHISANDEESSLYSVIDKETLKTEYYISQVSTNVRLAIGPEGYRVPSLFLRLVLKMQSSHAYQETLKHEDSLPEQTLPDIADGDAMDILPLGNLDGISDEGILSNHLIGFGNHASLNYQANFDHNSLSLSNTSYYDPSWEMFPDPLSEPMPELYDWGFDP